MASERTDDPKELLAKTAADLEVTTLVYPHQTGGGPCNPEKGPNVVLNMQSFWLNEYCHGSTQDSLVQLQYHKATRQSIRFFVSLSGNEALAEMRRIRASKGDLNLDPYRIIIARGPQYAAIATSSDWDQLKSDYKRLHALGEAFRIEFGDSAAQMLISWVIQQKIGDLATDLDLRADEKAKIFYELVNLHGLSPVQLANLERGYHELWKNGTGSSARVAEMMTWACSWAVEETIRKFQDRRKGDQWGSMPDLQSRLNAMVSISIPKHQGVGLENDSTLASASDSAMSLISTEDHPVYGVYFRMIRSGIPRGAVEIKMRNEGCDPALLNVSATTLSLLGVSACPAPHQVTNLQISLQNFQLRKTDSNARTAFDWVVLAAFQTSS